MARTIIDVHVIQTVPPSNLNRDDTGSPKTATYGGVRRARVSSQAWKRATRTEFNLTLDPAELGVRSKRVVELIGAEITRLAPDLSSRTEELAKAVLAAAGIDTAPSKRSTKEAPLPDEAKYLIFFSRSQILGLAELAVEAARAAGDGTPSIDKKDAKQRADRSHSVDVSLFGRMIAESTDLNVDAAAQVAHALSVHEVISEYDYFTAVDDHKQADDAEDAGAGMIGTVEFNSSTLYRYATVDVDRLMDNLGDAAVTRSAVEAFIRSFVASMPTGKQNTFANRTLPDAVLVVARDTQPINLVGAFEEPVGGGEEGGRIAGAIRRLSVYARELHDAYTEVPVAAWWVGVGSRAEILAEIGEGGSLPEVVARAGELVEQRLDARS